MTLINGNLILGSTILKRNSKIVTISYKLQDCVSSTTISTTPINASFQTTIKSLTPLAYCGVQVIMGNKDITAEVYDIYTGTINITSVKSNITIKAETLTTFEKASWYAVKCVAQSNIMNNEEALYNLSWRLGDTKPLVIGEYTYNVRICDLTPNRYQYVDNGERYSNMVLECVELLPDSRVRGGENNGNYDDNHIRNFYNEELILSLESDLIPLLEMLKLPIFYYNNVTGFSNNKLFMPGRSAMGNGNYEQEVIYQYYELHSTEARRKHKVNNSTNIDWWLRTGSYDNDGNYGGWSGHIGSIVFAEGGFSAYLGNQNNYYITNSYGVPVFWAW